MVDAVIEFDARQERELQRMLRDVCRGMARAKGRAIRDTTRAARVRVVRNVAGDLNVKQAELYQSGNGRRPIVEKLDRAGRDVIRGRVEVTGKRIPLSRFKARACQKGVRYQIDRGGASKMALKAFKVRFQSGHEAVVKRSDTKRQTQRGRHEQPIYELFGPSVPQSALTRAGVPAFVVGQLPVMYVRAMAREVEYLFLKGRAAGG